MPLLRSGIAIMTLDEFLQIVEETYARNGASIDQLLAMKALVRSAYNLGYYARQDELMANLQQAAVEMRQIAASMNRSRVFLLSP